MKARARTDAISPSPNTRRRAAKPPSRNARASRTSARADAGKAAAPWAVRTRGGRTFRGERELGGKVAAALAREEERRAEAARRKHFSAGRVRHRDLGSGCRTAGPDLGRDGCSAAQAADQNQPQLALAVFRPTQHHP